MLLTVLAAVVLAVVVCWLVRRRHRAEVRQTAAAEVFRAGDAAELDEGFAAVEAELGRERDQRLAAVLQPLVSRAVPARGLEAVPALHGARLRFADGTTVVVRGDEPGNVGVLAVWMRQRSLAPSACSTDASGTHLRFGSPAGRGSLSLLVTGLDQPD